MCQRALFFLLIAAGPPVYAQLDNGLFEDRLAMPPADTNKLFAGFKMLGFVKNNEYFNTIVEGYSLLGYQVQPYLSYRVSRHVRLDAGAFFQRDFGTSGFETIAPTLSLKLQYGRFGLIFGNLESSLNHRLLEPLYDFERVLNQRLETGLQLQWIGEKTFLDVWLDWQNMIYNNDPEQEEFVGGISLNQKLTSGKWNLSLPLQVVAGHKGGQINFNPPPLETVYNTAAGLEARREAGGRVQGVTFSGFYLYYRNPSSVLQRPYRDGEGWYFNGDVKLKFGLDVMLSYWQGREFQSVQGGKIYPSVSYFDHTVQKEKTQLLILRLLYRRQLAPTLQGSLRLQPYYDFGFGSMQYSAELYLVFSDCFFLTERKRR